MAKKNDEVKVDIEQTDSTVQEAIAQETVTATIKDETTYNDLWYKLFANKAPYKDKGLEFLHDGSNKPYVRLRCMEVFQLDDRGGRLVRQMNDKSSVLVGSELRVSSSPFRLQKGSVYRLITQVAMRQDRYKNAIILFDAIFPALAQMGVLLHSVVVAPDTNGFISVVVYATRTIEVSSGFPIGYIDPVLVKVLEEE